MQLRDQQKRKLHNYYYSLFPQNGAKYYHILVVNKLTDNDSVIILNHQFTSTKLSHDHHVYLVLVREIMRYTIDLVL